MRGRAVLITPELSCTGAPNSTLNMACALQKIGYYPEIYSVSDGALNTEISEKGISVRTVKGIEDILQKRYSDGDICFVNTSMLADYAIELQRIMPTALIIREAKSIREFRDIYGVNLESVFGIKHVFCVSEYAQEEIEKALGIRPLILKNYVPDYYRKSHFLHRDEIVRFGIAGTVEKRKGFDTCVEAFLRLSKEYEYVELHLVGRTLDWQRDFWELLFTRTSSMSNIIYHGEITSREKMTEFYELVDVIVVASMDESCSLVALEAASMAKYLILSDHTGARYILARANGSVFEAGGVDSLYSEMRKAVRRRRELRIRGRISRMQYLKMASEKRYIGKLEKAIEIIKRGDHSE